MAFLPTCACFHNYVFIQKTFLRVPSIQRFALTLQNWNARGPNHKINYCCLQNVDKKAVHMNVIMWLGFLFSL